MHRITLTRAERGCVLERLSPTSESRVKGYRLGSTSTGRSAVRVLVVDDDPTVRGVTVAYLEMADGFEVVGEASNGVEAILKAKSTCPDCVLMDVEMPVLNGAEATAEITRTCPDTRVVAFTGSVESHSITQMIVAGATCYAVKGDPSKIVDAVTRATRSDLHIDAAAMPGLFDGVVELAREERCRREESDRLRHELEDLYRETVSALAAALDTRDSATHDHVDRVADRSVAVARMMGVTGADIRDVEYGAIFHDVGKIGIPDSILKSPNRLTDEEFELIKMHTIYGEQIIKQIGFMKNVATIVRHSHEHFDGSGYPDGLVGEQIPLGSRIILACDAFDAMTAGRKYQAALSNAVAIGRLRRASGGQFDPSVIEAFLEVLTREGVNEAATDEPALARAAGA